MAVAVEDEVAGSKEMVLVMSNKVDVFAEAETLMEPMKVLGVEAEVPDEARIRTTQMPFSTEAEVVASSTGQRLSTSNTSRRVSLASLMAETRKTRTGSTNHLRLTRVSTIRAMPMRRRNHKTSTS